MRNDKKQEKRVTSEFDHSGHRERLREEFLKNGAEKMRDYEILEFLLFYCIPRKDTRPIARRLLNKFGSLSAVLDASVNELVEVEGVGRNSAALLSLLPSLAGRYLTDGKTEKKAMLCDHEKLADYLAGYFVGKCTECFFVLCMDGARRPIRCELLNEGEEYNVVVNVRRMGLIVAESKAAYVAVAHNHPLSSSVPSAADVELTQKIADVVSALGAQLVDHLIFGTDGDFSMANSGFYYSRYFR
ncbi:MAG: RadC family protein [Clostridia bacterium]|nr:RadC family protein [Clostridia bacterium]